MAQSFDLVEEAELGPGMGTFLAHDHPGSLGPGGEVEAVGDLGHPGAVADLAIVFACLDEGALWQRNNRFAHVFVDGEPEAEGNTLVPAERGEAVRGPRRVGPHQEAGTIGVASFGPGHFWKCSEGHGEHTDVVGGGVRPRPAFAHDAGEPLARRDLGAIQEAQEWMKAERVLPRSRGQFLVGMGDDDGGVDVQAQLAANRSGAAPASQAAAPPWPARRAAWTGGPLRPGRVPAMPSK